MVTKRYFILSYDKSIFVDELMNKNWNLGALFHEKLAFIAYTYDTEMCNACDETVLKSTRAYTETKTI